MRFCQVSTPANSRALIASATVERAQPALPAIAHPRTGVVKHPQQGRTRRRSGHDGRDTAGRFPHTKYLTTSGSLHGSPSELRLSSGRRLGWMRRRSPEDEIYLVWSQEMKAWWGADARSYVQTGAG